MNSTALPRNGYDAFLSHNHADKALARALAGRLASVDFHGRPLRPWLHRAELTSALDRSRTLLLT